MVFIPFFYSGASLKRLHKWIFVFVVEMVYVFVFEMVFVFVYKASISKEVSIKQTGELLSKCT